MDLRRNNLLAKLPPPAVQALASHAKDAELLRGEQVLAQGQLLETVLFPVAGIVSQFQVSAYGRRIEVAMTGREGCTALALLLGAERATEELCVLVPGRAVCIPSPVLLSISREHRPVRDLLLRYVQATTVQKANIALSHGLDVIETRLARWLLMCQDRLESAELPLTHEQLSTALGVRRSGVTSALHTLEGQRLLRSVRGRVLILDRPGLQTVAADSYGAPEAEYARLIGAGSSATDTD